MSARRRRGLVRLVVLLLVLAVVSYPVLLGVTGYRAIHRVGALPASSLADTPGTTTLLVGSDSRADLTRDQRVALSAGEDVEGKRTDTIMLLHRPAGGGPVVLLSIPRDSYVAIPGHGKNKINAAYSLGGMALLAQTVEQATGLRVDDYAETGLGGFAGLVDAVGGVTMCPATAMKDPKAGLDIPAGCQRMDGATALGYARSRDLDKLGDLGRAQRQRELIAAIAAKAATPSTLVDPFKAFPLAKAAGGALSADDDFGPGDLLGFARAMKAVAGGSAVSLNVPVASTTRRTSAGLVVDWDAKAAKAVFDDIRSDDTQALKAVAAAQPSGSES
jgi:LCP family protein required for cell wall assembly